MPNFGAKTSCLSTWMLFSDQRCVVKGAPRPPRCWNVVPNPTCEDAASFFSCSLVGGAVGRQAPRLHLLAPAHFLRQWSLLWTITHHLLSQGRFILANWVFLFRYIYFFVKASTCNLFVRSLTISWCPCELLMDVLATPCKLPRSCLLTSCKGLSELLTCLTHCPPHYPRHSSGRLIPFTVSSEPGARTRASK